VFSPAKCIKSSAKIFTPASFVLNNLHIAADLKTGLLWKKILQAKHAICYAAGLEQFFILLWEHRTFTSLSYWKRKFCFGAFNLILHSQKAASLPGKGRI
jgi:hypothetical protein